MRLRILATLFIAFVLAAPAVAQQEPSPLTIEGFHHDRGPIGRVFSFDVANASDREVRAYGRMVAINVYDTAQPVSVPVNAFIAPARGRATLEVAWPDAPIIGQVRLLLVLNDGTHTSLVHPTTTWIIPYALLAWLLGGGAAAIALALAALRLPKYLEKRVPANMVPYLVEADDTVVTLSTRFDVTWQDIVRANRLKPPYNLKPGSRILIPKHALRRPAPTAADRK